jgi:hypothetical protein
MKMPLNALKERWISYVDTVARVSGLSGVPPSYEFRLQAVRPAIAII